MNGKKNTKKDERETVRNFTKLLEERLKALTINAPDWSTLRAIGTARDLYVPVDTQLTNAKYVELTQKFTQGYNIAMTKDGEKVNALRRDIENYQLRLNMLGLKDKDVVKNKRWNRLHETMLLNLLILWPFALLGSAIHLPIAIISRFGGKIFAKGEIEEEATFKIFFALVPFFTLYTLIPLVVGIYYGLYNAIVALFFLLLSGYAAVHVRPWGNSVDFLRSLLTMVPKDLREERENLRQRLLLAINEFYEGPKMFETETSRE